MEYNMMGHGSSTIYTTSRFIVESTLTNCISIVTVTSSYIPEDSLFSTWLYVYAYVMVCLHVRHTGLAHILVCMYMRTDSYIFPCPSTGHKSCTNGYKVKM